eukprot:6445395-Ditylum_brightwellii.AAC.1
MPCARGTFWSQDKLTCVLDVITQPPSQGEIRSEPTEEIALVPTTPICVPTLSPTRPPTRATND